jgi:hypothetical protein
MFSFLKEKGLRVKVIASRGNPIFLDRENREVSYVNDFIHKGIGKAKSRIDDGHAGCLPRFLRTFFKNVLGELMVPDFGILMCRRYFNAAKKLMNGEKAGILVTSGPVHSVHLVGLLLKRLYGNRFFWIVDYRDSWNCSFLFRKKSALANFLSVKLEKRVLAGCDHFTYVSDPIVTKAMEKFGLDLSQKGTLIMNGHTGGRKAARPVSGSGGEKAQKKKVGHFGFIGDYHGFRDLRILLSYADALGFVVSRNFEFHFFGEVRLFNTDIGKFKNIFMHEPVAYGDVQEEMSRMDFLLIYHTESRDADEVMTGKVFDYMAARKPIICMGPPDMEVVRIIEENGIGVGVNYRDRKAVEERLDDLWRNDFKYNDGFDFRKYDRKRQYVKLAEIIDGVE